MTICITDTLIDLGLLKHVREKNFQISISLEDFSNVLKSPIAFTNQNELFKLITMDVVTKDCHAFFF